MAPKVKLTYFNVQAKAEAARMILKLGKIDFEDRRVEFEEWREGSLKAATPFGQMPIIEWDGLELAQSGTIVRFVAKKTNLAGKTEEEIGQVDMVFEYCQELMSEFIKMRWNPADTKQEKVTAFLETYIPKWLGNAEKILKKNGGEWFVKSGVTYADLQTAVLIDWLGWKDEKAFVDVTGTDARFTIMDGYPLLKALYNRVKALPEIKAYMESRPVTNPPGL